MRNNSVQGYNCYGGGMAAIKFGATVNLNDSIVEDNSLLSGVTASGVGLYFVTSSATLRRASIKRNIMSFTDYVTANVVGRGGGLCASGLSLRSFLHSVVAEDNVINTMPLREANIRGAGIYMNALATSVSVVSNRCVVRGNKLLYSGTGFSALAYGGGFYVFAALTMNHGVVTGNVIFINGPAWDQGYGAGAGTIAPQTLMQTC